MDNRVGRGGAEVLETEKMLAKLVKWLLMGSIAGVMAAVGIMAFLKLLYMGIDLAEKASALWWVLLPVGGLVSTNILKFAPMAAGHGTEAVIRSVNKLEGYMPLAVAPIKAAATIISISAGASLGKEGPAAQIGGAITSTLGRLLRLDEPDRRRITLCGMAAGFSIVSGAPIAGAIFAAEALVMSSLNYTYILPCLVTSITSLYTARVLDAWLGLHAFHPLWDIEEMGALFEGVKPFSVREMLPFFLLTLVGALLIGFAARLFVKSAEISERIFHRIKLEASLKTALGGILLILMALVFGRQYLGLGIHELSDPALAGESVPYLAFALKILFVAVSLGCGFSGGAVTPIFVIGSVAGAALGRALGMDIRFAAGIGMVTFLAGAANTPITATILGLELFGPAFGVFGTLAALVAYCVSGNSSINASQIFGGPKPCYENGKGKAGMSFEEMHEGH